MWVSLFTLCFHGLLLIKYDCKLLVFSRSFSGNNLLQSYVIFHNILDSTHNKGF